MSSNNNTSSTIFSDDPYQEVLLVAIFEGLSENLFCELHKALDKGKLQDNSVIGRRNFNFVKVNECSLNNQLSVASLKIGLDRYDDCGLMHSHILLVIPDNFQDAMNADERKTFYGEKLRDAARFGAAILEAGIKLHVVLVRNSTSKAESIAEGLLTQIENETNLEEPPIEVKISDCLEHDHTEFYRRIVRDLWYEMGPICDQVAVRRYT